MARKTKHDDSNDLVSLREAERRLGISNLSHYFTYYGSRPEPDEIVRTSDGRPVHAFYRMRTIRAWYAATVANPRKPA